MVELAPIAATDAIGGFIAYISDSYSTGTTFEF
jgi:hypothetical protein